ncbi:unnamed protein product [Camellia sinensis]
MCNKDTSPLQHSSMIDTKPTLTLKPSRKTRSKTRKPKFLSLRLELTQQSGEMTTTTISAATRRQLNLFPLHPETSSVEEKDTVAYFFDSADGGATTLTTLLGTGSSSEDDTTAVSPPSLTYAYGGQDSEEEGKLLVRTALRNKERDASEEKWVSYSEVVERKDEEVTSCAADLRCGARKMKGLSLKLDYQEILNAWCDKGPLYIQLESPQTVPDLHDDSSNHTKGPSRQIVSSGPSGKHGCFVFQYLTAEPLSFMQSHQFIKKFEDKDIDLGILVGSLEPPTGAGLAADGRQVVARTSLKQQIMKALQGIDIKEMLAGASLMDEANRTTVIFPPDVLKFSSFQAVRDNPTTLLALSWYWASGGVGSKIWLFFLTRIALLLFSTYLQQLVMESLGKEFDLEAVEECS